MTIFQQQWLTAVVTIGILVITLAPFFLQRFWHVYIPSEFVLLTMLFVFSSLFLGEVRGFYTRFWWWDLVLHASSGFLLGMIGFVLVYVLNETKHIGVYMKPGFVALFAFLFAIGIGTIWEIYEFAMDQLFGMNMQKAMLGDPSGLTDTMWDLIVDSLGALIISIMGYGYLKKAKNKSFLERGIHNFIRKNPRLFPNRK
ncbi:hypothetical protein NBRC116188_25200 [Oceaniserpentilla sp. 4NH20-0058]|uniref:hypothetical protein n=1 Tax=Oceaniserpentilla sp. 4NH20-0058 TaxID=3127660 RepID=UPI00310ACC53